MWTCKASADYWVQGLKMNSQFLLSATSSVKSWTRLHILLFFSTPTALAAHILSSAGVICSGNTLKSALMKTQTQDSRRLGLHPSCAEINRGSYLNVDILNLRVISRGIMVLSRP